MILIVIKLNVLHKYNLFNVLNYKYTALIIKLSIFEKVP